MKALRTLTAAAIITMGYGSSVFGASITDGYDPYVTVNEIQAVPSTPSKAQLRMADIYDPFILSNEIVVSESCNNPAHELIADSYGSLVTQVELMTAEMNRKC